MKVINPDRLEAFIGAVTVDYFKNVDKFHSIHQCIALAISERYLVTERTSDGESPDGQT